MRLRNILLTAMLTALALVFNMVEGTLPLPLPGVKLGAANVFALVALATLGAKEAFAVTILRVLLAWLITGNWFAFLCGLAGGTLATAAMAFLYAKFRSDFTLPWISVAGAWAFNAGQIFVVIYLIGDERIAVYVLPLLISGTLAGYAVGYLAQLLCDRLDKIHFEHKRKEV